MANIGIFFGSSTGTTEDVAVRVADRLNVSQSDVHNVASADAAAADAYDVLILGSSTWGDGELQDDWIDFIEKLKSHVSGKKVAFFGCGDGDSYDTTFCDAVGLLYDELQGTGATFVGAYAPEGYSYTDSKAERDGKLVGLCLDEVNYPEESDARMDKWIAALDAAI